MSMSDTKMNIADKAKVKVKSEFSKGDVIRFIAGAYSGKKGWVNAAVANDNEKNIYVLVDCSDTKKNCVRLSCVLRTSISYEKNYNVVNSLAEAILQQCPDVERKLVSVCRAFTITGIDNDNQGFMQVVSHYMTKALVHQKNKGKKALYRKIEFHP